MDFGVAGVRTEEEDFEILRNRIIECICHKARNNNLTTFHGVDMVRESARGFFEQRGVDVYQFSGEHELYRHVLERIYRPLAEAMLIEEYENNTFRIPTESRLHEICTEEFATKEYIKWDEFRVPF